MSARLPSAVGRNGHAVSAEAQRATAEQRRRELDAAYTTLPTLLLDDFERTALRQEINVRLGALQLVALVRRRRAKALLPPRTMPA